jgi:LmbE family N-acetylglucosaminyl deacetylase
MVYLMTTRKGGPWKPATMDRRGKSHMRKTRKFHRTRIEPEFSAAAVNIPAKPYGPGVVVAAFLAALAFLAIVSSGPLRGQTSVATVSPAPLASRPLEIDSGAARVWQTIRQLRTRGSLLMVTAHPDDEDGGMLAYESRGQGARVALMTLNRGEGGQNAMSDDYYDALGLVRTEELLAADRYYGVQQFWSSVTDFGFSKTAEESLSQWGHDRVLADVVRVVRMTRPLVVTSVFVGGPTDGHGHHAVAGQMAQEVFAAAGDPNMFPEQIRAGLRPWSPLKMYARVPNVMITDKGMFDSATGKYHPVRFYDYIHKKWSDGLPAVNLEVPEGDYDPVLGATYVQIAREGWSLQKSQNGGGQVPFAGPTAMAYHRYDSLVSAADKEQSFFDGVDVSLAGIADLAHGEDSGFLKAGLGRIDALVEQSLGGFSMEHPEKIAPLLAAGLKETDALVGQVSASSLSEQAKYDVLHELAAKQEQFQRAITEALGFSLDAIVGPKQEPRNRPGPFGPQITETFAYAVPGQEFAVRVHMNNPGANALHLERVWLEAPHGETWAINPETPVPASLSAAQALDQRFIVRLPENAEPTRPYFTRPNDEQPYYDLSNESDRNLSRTPYPLSAWAELDYEGAKVRVGGVVQTARQDAGSGLELNPLMVTPAISVGISPQAGIIPFSAKSFALSALVHTESEGGGKGTVRLEMPPGWRSEPSTASFELQRPGQEQSVSFQVYPDRLMEKPYTVTAVAESAGRQYREGFTTVGYRDLRPSNLYMPATYRTSGLDVKVAPGLRVGYVTGTGDAVPQTLENIGIKVEFLSPQDLAQGDLQKFNCILLGVRAYTARPELASNNSRLLEYVRNGGVLVVQYQAAQYDHNYGPYSYSLPNDAERVVDEQSPITFLDPKDPLLSWPNQINQKDFAGWVEERGHNFMKSWDAHYKAPIETHDAEQDPQRGGLIYATYGRGVYVYEAFALYRELPDGVPGAYRLFANLLSLPRNPALNLPGTPGAAPSGAAATSAPKR